MITYEYPLNERVRTWLRFDRLFAKYELAINDKDSKLWPISALDVLMEITDIAERSDLKNDMIKELTKLKVFHEALQKHEDVDVETLSELTEQTEKAIAQLRLMPGRPSQQLNNNPWFNLVRTRLSIPGGSNDFDVPSLYWWNNLSEEEKLEDVSNFFKIFLPFVEAVKIILYNIRESAEDKEMLVEKGTLSMASNKNNVLIQIKMSDDSIYYPEVSANRFQSNIRLLQIQKDNWESGNVTTSPNIIIRQCFLPSEFAYKE